MDKDTEDMMRTVQHAFDFNNTAKKNKLISHKITDEPWEVIDTELFTINSSNFYSLVDYSSMFSIGKWVEKLSAESLITCCKIICAEYRLPTKESLNVGNFFVEKFKVFYIKLDAEQSISSS